MRGDTLAVTSGPGPTDTKAIFVLILLLVGDFVFYCLRLCDEECDLKDGGPRVGLSSPVSAFSLQPADKSFV